MKTVPLDVKKARRREARRERKLARRRALLEAAASGATFAELPTTAAPKKPTLDVLPAFALTTMTPALAYFILTSPRRLPPPGRARVEYENFINELRAQLQHLGINTDGNRG